LGQHFLTDIEIIQRIVDAAALDPADHVFEIGPGRGALTFPLLGKAASVTSLELDPDLVGQMKSHDLQGFRLVKGDALTEDFAKVVGDVSYDRSVLVANLPYRITGALLERILEAGCWNRAVLMVQREVGRRLAAEVGSKDYGILTIAANLRAEVEYLFSVPPKCFDPPPKVVSSVVQFTFREGPAGVSDEKLFFRIVRSAFQQRRKMLRNSLAVALDGCVEEVLAAAKIDPAVRPEAVSVEGFDCICRAFTDTQKRADG
jgi:16S rRNA (adenine1518-N6/adenine1519-N6)-dimethyltransferase